MTTRLVGSRTSDETKRLDKNRRIKESIKRTKARRKSQVCKTFDLKIVGNKLSRKQREALAARSSKRNGYGMNASPAATRSTTPPRPQSRSKPSRAWRNANTRRSAPR